MRKNWKSFDFTPFQPSRYHATSVPTRISTSLASAAHSSSTTARTTRSDCRRTRRCTVGRLGPRTPQRVSDFWRGGIANPETSQACGTVLRKRDRALRTYEIWCLLSRDRDEFCFAPVVSGPRREKVSAISFICKFPNGSMCLSLASRSGWEIQETSPKPFVPIPI